MKFKNYISRPGKSWKIEFMTGRLVTAGAEKRRQCRIETSN